ncbi:enoyl-CoA hydratase/isomerase family protein [Rhodococcus qingshengii]|uniref:enoyl-CoA hydratase/isomerase family protein n=1 Tax=Rhodococcus TaxID=1827 RepID=UPI001BAFD297|nr:enoyl-CoA hydratase-related protein [Rhodococcus qingshengii]MBS3695681.1 enoyl-CoA hydratase/isomerase family protein [Rhodococcus qingshengii]
MSNSEMSVTATLVDGVLHLPIATAAAGTSMDFTLIAQATAALHGHGAEVGAVLLTGTGANFCAGGNVLDFAAADDRGAYLHEKATALHAFVDALTTSPVPVVAAVQGWAAGAGMSLVCASDIAIGGPSTRMRPAYPGIGLSPDGGITWSLPRIVGARRAREILLSDTVVDAEEAARLGLLSRIVRDTDVQTEALRVARGFVEGPRATYTTIRQLLTQSPDATLTQQLDAERDGIARAANSATGRVGVDAFVAKKRPDFTGVGQ